MAFEIGLSDAGFVAPRSADYLEAIRADLASRLGIEISWDDDLVYGHLTMIMAQKLGELSELAQAVYDSWDPAVAQGVLLANIAAINGVTVKRATKSRATLTLSGTSGTVVVAGKQALGGGTDGLALWATATDATIPSGGSVDVLAECVTPGRILADAGAISEIATPVSGWSGVTNVAAAQPGVNNETSDQLRVRRVQALQVGGGVSYLALRSKLLNLGFIEAAVVIDNPDNDPATVEGIAMPAHSALAIVLPDSLVPDEQQQVLELLYQNTPPATRWNGSDVIGTVTGPDNVQHPVSFSYATELAADFVSTITVGVGFNVADAAAELRRLTEDYVGTLQIGQPLYGLQVTALAAKVPGVIGFSVTINGLGNLAPAATERVVFGTWAVA